MGVSGVTATKKERTNEPKGEKESIIVSPSPKKAMPPLRIAAVGKTNGPLPPPPPPLLISCTHFFEMLILMQESLRERRSLGEKICVSAL